jgi:hypothetical protein
MPDVATISAFLGSIKTATDIARAISLSDSALEKAQLKLRIAELMETLADAKIQAIEIQELLQVKESEIARLKNSDAYESLEDCNDLHDDCLSVLLVLKDGLSPSSSPFIASKLDIGVQKADYLLDILKHKKLLRTTYKQRFGLTYYLNEKSRKLLFDKGHL